MSTGANSAEVFANSTLKSSIDRVVKWKIKVYKICKYRSTSCIIMWFTSQGVKLFGSSLPKTNAFDFKETLGELQKNFPFFLHL